MSHDYDLLSERITALASQMQIILKLVEENKSSINSLFKLHNNNAQKIAVLENQILIIQKLEEIFPELMALLEVMNKRFEENKQELTEELTGDLKEGIPPIRHMLYELTDRNMRGDKLHVGNIILKNIKNDILKYISFGLLLSGVYLLLKGLGVLTSFKH